MTSNSNWKLKSLGTFLRTSKSIYLQKQILKFLGKNNLVEMFIRTYIL